MDPIVDFFYNMTCLQFIVGGLGLLGMGYLILKEHWND
jgi:hypothetical protein